MIRKVTAVSQATPVETPVETPEVQAPVVEAIKVDAEETIVITNKNTEDKGEVKMSTPITGGIANLTKEQRQEMAAKAKIVMDERKLKGQVNYSATSAGNAADVLRDTTLTKTFKVKGHEIEVKSNIIEIIDKYRNNDATTLPVSKEDLVRILELSAAAMIDYAIEGHGVKMQGGKNNNVTFTIKNVYGKGVKHSVAALIQKPGRFLSSDKVRLTTEEFEG